MARRPPLSERIRLIRILRTHGLRAVERMRADELKVALEKLGLTLPAYDEEPPPEAAAPPPAPSSAELTKATEEEPVLKEVAVDPMDARYKEPKSFLPQGERTFLRLVAVDWSQLFATWDLDERARAKLGGDDARLKIRVADASSDEHGAFLSVEHIKVSARGWYLRAPEQRLRVVAVLTTPGGDVLAVSNAVIVPPNHAAPPGPLRFATVPVSVDRRRLRGGVLLQALIDDETDLPEGVVVAESGRQVRARDKSERDEDGSAPSSGKRRLVTQGGPPLSGIMAPPSSSAPSSSAPSSWKSAPSSSGAQR